MTPSQKGWHYLAVKNISASLRGITLKYVGDFDCLGCFHSLGTKNKLVYHKNIQKYIFGGALMLSEETKILEFNKY